MGDLFRTDNLEGSKPPAEVKYDTYEVATKVTIPGVITVAVPQGGRGGKKTAIARAKRELKKGAQLQFKPSVGTLNGAVVALGRKDGVKFAFAAKKTRKA